MQMAKFLIAGAVAVSATGALASPAAFSTLAADAPAVEAIHHKPGHQGGPPWTRGRGGDDDRRSYTPERVTRRVCETRMQNVYDPYRDEYVRRETQVCRNV